MAILHRKAKPGGRASQLLVGPGGAVMARLAAPAPAHDGQANAALQGLLAATFGLAKRDVTLLAGHAAPFKKWSWRGRATKPWPGPWLN